jgi:hypothetical protein
MRIDPGMHIGLHLVFFGKTGVTVYTRLQKKMPRAGSTIMEIKHSSKSFAKKPS